MRDDFWPEFWQAGLETLLMLGVGLPIAGIFGLILGTLLFWWRHPLLGHRLVLYRLLGTTVNVVRSFPFVILMIAVIPLSRIVAQSSIGPLAASVPLALAGTAYFARLVEIALNEVSPSILEAGIAIGARPLELVRKVIFSEARSSLVLAFTSLTVSYLSYSAAAGIIGGGGIGDLAIRYGYYRFETDVMIFTVLVLVLFVQFFQSLGSGFARYLDRHHV